MAWMSGIAAGDRTRVFLGSKPPPPEWTRRTGRLVSTPYFTTIVRMQWPSLGASRSEVRWAWVCAGFLTVVLVGGLFSGPWWVRALDVPTLGGVTLPWIVRLARWRPPS